MIGFTDVSEESRKLEEAARGGDADYINAHHEQVMEKCKDAAKLIASVLGIKLSYEDIPSGNPDDEVLEFGADTGDEEVLEFGADGDDEALEFDAVETAPGKGGEQA